MSKIKKVMVTGGAGYVGAVLIPKLLNSGYEVIVLDLFLYGEEVFNDITDRENLTLIKGDIRNQTLLHDQLVGCDAVIHLACISNDPSFELNPELGKSINFDAFEPLVKISKSKGVKRFIYASSSSVYGIKQEEQVTEDLTLEPLTDYSKYKAMCEDILLSYSSDDFVTLTVRPATVCGYSPRQRLDLVVNILVNHAYTNNKIKVFGGDQYRPNIHIDDMTDFYLMSLAVDKNLINGETYNIGSKNQTVAEIANIVKQSIGEQVEVEVSAVDDPRSYRISSEKVKRELNFSTQYTIDDAVNGLKDAFDKQLLKNSMTEARYFNIKMMQKINLV